MVGVHRDNPADLGLDELGDLFRHSISPVIHRVLDETGDRLKCGREINSVYERLHQVLQVLQCRRSDPEREKGEVGLSLTFPVFGMRPLESASFRMLGV